MDVAVRSPSDAHHSSAWRSYWDAGEASDPVLGQGQGQELDGACSKEGGAGAQEWEGKRGEGGGGGQGEGRGRCSGHKEGAC